MKACLLLCMVAVTTTPAAAQWAVFDVANLQQNITNYAAMLEQLANQAEQIQNQLQQIRHMEDQLERMGKLAEIKAVIGFPELHVDIRLPSKIEMWDDGLIIVDGWGLFDDSRGKIFEPITPDFPDFEGGRISRKAEVYKPEHEITLKVDNFKEVQKDIYERRAELRRAIAVTLDALRRAATEAEFLKLQAVVNAQYDELAAIDAEVELSAAEVQVKVAQTEAMQRAQSKADAEVRVNLVRIEVGRISTTFTPIYHCLLQHVREQRYAP